ncbi:hypothetical protein ACOSQ4_000871 [Xanthoceras sorbifolium]
MIPLVILVLCVFFGGECGLLGIPLFTQQGTLFFLDIVSWASSFLDKVRAVVAPIDVRLVSRCKDVKWKPPKVVHGLTKFGLFFVNNFVWRI